MAGKSSTDDVRRQRARLLEVRTEDAEIDLAERRGELVPVSALTQTAGNLIVTARQHLLIMPGRIAGQLVGEPAPVIREKLRVEVHAVLTRLTMPEAYHEPGTCDCCGGPKPPLPVNPATAQDAPVNGEATSGANGKG